MPINSEPKNQKSLKQSLSKVQVDTKVRILGKFNSKYKDVIKLTGKIKKKK